MSMLIEERTKRLAAELALSVKELATSSLTRERDAAVKEAEERKAAAGALESKIHAALVMSGIARKHRDAIESVLGIHVIEGVTVTFRGKL